MLLSLLAPISPAMATGAPTIVGGANVSGGNGVPVAITDLSVNANGASNVPVRLHVSNGELDMATTTGLTFSGQTSGPSLNFSGAPSDVNAALATLTYTSYSPGTDNLEVSLIGADEVYYPANGHLYEYVPVAGQGIDWPDASAAASARTKDGLSGYLVTITSQGENDYVASRLVDAGWMGASDAATEGDWKWVDGPEAGTSFYSGNGTAGGHDVNGGYDDWNNQEPNDAGGNEDCGQYLAGSSGQWNDLPCDNTALLGGYVVEYGAPGSVPQVASKTIGITTAAPVTNVATCAQLEAIDTNTMDSYNTVNLTADIDCTGETVHSLYPQGGYRGVFNGHGHKITHVTINENTSEVGLFSILRGATVKNVTLDTGLITSNSYEVGALAGEADDATIDNVTSHFDVSCDSYCGGLIGGYYTSVTGGTTAITNTYVTGDVTDVSGYSGGLVGDYEITDATSLIQHVSATGNVDGDANGQGGLLGYISLYGNSFNSVTTIEDSYARGNVNAHNNYYAGGLIGMMAASSMSSHTAHIVVQRTYASGAVTGAGDAGGLIGRIQDFDNGGPSYTFTDNFAAGVVTSDPGYSGGLIGTQNVTTPSQLTSSGNYFDATRSTLANCTTQNAMSGCTGVATTSNPAYFMRHTNAPMTAWNFTSIWHENTNDWPTFAPTAALPGADSDGDGITDSMEAAAPNNGDGNNDGVADATQANVTSALNAATGKYITTVLSNACSTTAASTSAETANAVKDSGYDYPGGLMSYTADCGTNGFVATATVYFYGLTPASFVARKYNPATLGYATIPGATTSQVSIGGQIATKLVYQITDGGPLDQDGSANGIIVDPVGLGVNVVGVPDTGRGGLSRS